LDAVSLFAPVLSVLGVLLALGAIVYFLIKVGAGAGKREGAQERMKAKFITITLLVIAGALQAIAYSLQ
jgi:hypothetical protein